MRGGTSHQELSSREKQAAEEEEGDRGAERESIGGYEKAVWVPLALSFQTLLSSLEILPSGCPLILN